MFLVLVKKLKVAIFNICWSTYTIFLIEKQTNKIATYSQLWTYFNHCCMVILLLYAISVLRRSQTLLETVKFLRIVRKQIVNVKPQNTVLYIFHLLLIIVSWNPCWLLVSHLNFSFFLSSQYYLQIPPGFILSNNIIK